MDEEARSAVETLLGQVQAYREGAARLKDMLLANLVMVGEIPAATCQEEKRIRFIMDRFRECELDVISTDEAHNVLSVLPGRVGKDNILVCAHIDTWYGETVDHTVRVGTESIGGAGIADNSLGVAVLCTLPTILQELKVSFDANLILMGASQSLGRGNLQGIEFFLDHHPGAIRAGVCVEGVDLGRLSYRAIGMLRGEIIGRTVPNGVGNRAENRVIGALSETIRLIEEIPMPSHPPTTINLGSVHAGDSFYQPVEEGSVKFEIRSAMKGMVPKLQLRLEEIVSRVTLERELELELEVIARRRNGGLEFEHPLPAFTRSVMKQLGVRPLVRPSVGELSSLIARNIPGVTLGITERTRGVEAREAVRIEPMFAGIAQLVAMLQAIDFGICDGDNE